jgi:hypothetical protein
MVMPRMREQQVNQLQGRNLETIIQAKEKLPYYCQEVCEERSLHCSAGWILDRVSTAKNLQESPEKFSEREIRNLNSEIVIIPLLLVQSVECEFEVRIGRLPIGLELLDLIEQVRLIQRGQI